MESYRDILIYTISAISKIYLVYTAILVLVLVFSLIIKSKKVRNVMLVLLICTLITYSVLVIPRFYDLHNNSFINIEDATITLDDMYTVSTNIMFFGFASIVTCDGKTIEVLGTDFFEFPSSKLNEQYCGDIVYAKYSRQLISIENY